MEQDLSSLKRSLDVGDKESANQLLVKLLNETDPDSETTLLGHVAMMRDAELLKFVLENKDVLNQINMLSRKNSEKLSPLHWCVQNFKNYYEYSFLTFEKVERKLQSPLSSLECVQVLVEAGADVNISSNEHTPIQLAAENQHLDVVLYLIEHGAHVTKDSDTLSDLFYHVCHYNGSDQDTQLKCVERLLNIGADPHKPNSKGETPFFCSITNNQVFRKLMECNLTKANLDITIRGRSYLSYIIDNQYDIETIDTLLKTGCDVNLGDDTPLMAAAYNLREDIIKLLIKHGADVNSHNSDGLTAGNFCLEAELSEETEDSRLKILQLLVKFGLKTTNPHKSFYSSLFEGKFDSDCFKYLVSRGVNVNKVNDEGENILHLASSLCEEDDINVLFNSFVNMNQKSKTGNTPLMKAILDGNPLLVQILLERNCDVNALNQYGQSALSYAIKYDNMEYSPILDMVLSAGADLQQLDELPCLPYESKLICLLHHGADCLLDVRKKSANN